MLSYLREIQDFVIHGSFAGRMSITKFCGKSINFQITLSYLASAGAFETNSSASLYLTPATVYLLYSRQFGIY